MNLSLFTTVVACGLLTLVIAGCGKSGTRSEVRGQVLLDGKPLAGAEVQLLAKTGSGMHSGTTDAEGNFAIVEDAGSNTPIQPGEYVALVSKQTMPENAANLPGGGMGAMINVVPPLYQDRAASPLSAKVDGATTQLPPFEIKAEAK